MDHPDVSAWLDTVPPWSALAAYVGFWAVVAFVVTVVLRRTLARFARRRGDEPSEVLARSLPRPAGVGVLLIALAMGLRFLPLETRLMAEAHRFIAIALCILTVVLLMRVGLRARRRPPLFPEEDSRARSDPRRGENRRYRDPSAVEYG